MIRIKNVLSITLTLLIFILLPNIPAMAEENYTFDNTIGIGFVSQETNIRKAPNLSGEKVGKLEAGSEFVTSGRCNETDWYRISCEYGTCYISDKYVMDIFLKLGTECLKITTPVDIKQWPYEDSKVIGHFDANSNTVSAATTDDGEHYYIMLEENLKGFIPVSAAEITPRDTYDTNDSEEKDAKTARDVALFCKELVSSTKVMLIAMPIVILAVIFIAGLSKGNSVDSKSYPDLPVSPEKDTSIFGIDWDGDGKTSIADDFITMDMINDDFL